MFVNFRVTRTYFDRVRNKDVRIEDGRQLAKDYVKTWCSGILELLAVSHSRFRCTFTNLALHRLLFSWD